jgi:hypothetical protein
LPRNATARGRSTAAAAPLCVDQSSVQQQAERNRCTCQG